MAGKRIRAFTSIISVLKQHPRVSTVSPFVQRRKDELKDRKEIFHEVAVKKGSQIEVPTQGLFAHNLCILFN